MKAFLITLCSLVFFITLHGVAQQRVIAECTIEYKVSSVNSQDVDLQTSLLATTKNVYIKGNNSRVDLSNPSFKQTTFFDKNSGQAIVLREFGNNKFITKLSNDEWLNTNKKFEDIAVTTTNDTKTILGYECKKAVLSLKDGSSLIVYYVPTLIPSVKEVEYEFKEVPGLVLDYETTDEKQNTIHYTATKISFNPVPAHTFEIPPTAGYRLLK